MLGKKGNQHSVVPAGISVFLDKKQDVILQNCNRLMALSKKLCYEGKVFLGVNLKRFRKLWEDINEQLLSHMRGDEDVIFPFLETHIPRLVPFVHMLQEETREIRAGITEINCLLRLVNSARDAKERRVNVAMLAEKVPFVYCLIRSHLEMEGKSLYKWLFRVSSG